MFRRKKIKGAKTIVQFDLNSNIDARFAGAMLQDAGYTIKIEDTKLYVDVEQHKAVVI
jgi:hypothetical protein